VIFSNNTKIITTVITAAITRKIDVEHVEKVLIDDGRTVGVCVAGGKLVNI
jgi:hypothetical protein